MMKRKFLPFLAAAALVIFATAGIAASGTEAIKKRQEAMGEVREGMMALAAIAKGEAPFDAAVVAKNAGVIESHLTESAPHFPEGSAQGDVETWAKPEIWENMDDFMAKLEESKAAAAALKSVTEETAFRPAMGKLGSSCKACHTDYRRPKS